MRMFLRTLIPVFLLATSASAQTVDRTFRINDLKRDGKVTSYSLDKAPTTQRGLFVMFACYGGKFQPAGQNAYDPKKESFKKTFTGEAAEPDSMHLKVYPNLGPAYALRFVGNNPGVRTNIDNTCSM